MPDEKLPGKKSPAPKIVQVMTYGDGYLTGVLYSNGRVFFWTYTKLPQGKDNGEGFWAEIAYPDLK
jgi:hypothetical protein